MIVITGGAGFIGSALLWKFNQLGRTDILVVDQKAADSPKWKNLERLKFSDYVESDAFLDRLERNRFNGKIRALFHLGACSDTTEKDEQYLRENNSGYSERLAKKAAAMDCYFSYASSAAAYGAGENGYSDSDELTPRLKPLNPYGRSKLDFDLWVLRNNLQSRLIGFRFFNVYGPNEYHKLHMRSLVHKGFAEIQQTGSLKLFKSYRSDTRDGEQKRDFLYVKDAVDTVVWFYENPQWKGIYNVGSGTARTWNDLAAALFSACGKPISVEYIDMPDTIKSQYQYFTEADLTKLRKTGIPLKFRSLESGVADYVRKYLRTDDPCLGGHPTA